jgi:predicted RNA methylase
MKKNDTKIIKIDPVYKLDQFFTKTDIAVQCVKEVGCLYPLDQFDLIIEPSAGTGSFVKALPPNKKLAIEIDSDLCNANPDYLCQSFFDYKPADNSGKILVIGNPPFGTQNKLSVDFFNYAANFADVIAFIIPKTWNKQSIHNRLHEKFHLVKVVDLPGECFYGDKDTNVKCCFQIWKREKTNRVREEKCIVHKDWKFLSYVKTKTDLVPPEKADFVVLAYGSNPGQVSTDLYQWRPKSVHFIQSKIGKKKLMERFSALDFSCADNSARQSSLCKGDLVRLYMESYDD